MLLYSYQLLQYQIRDFNHRIGVTYWSIVVLHTFIKLLVFDNHHDCLLEGLEEAR
jgi:hypothetical protein